MKSILFVVITCISFCQSYGQNIFLPGKKFDHKSLKPVARQILADIRTNKKFDRFEIFQVYNNDSLNSALHSGADSFVVLDIKQIALNSLLSLRPQNLVLTVPNIDGGSTEVLLFKHDIATPEFQVTTSSGKTISGDELRGIHYWGIIKDQFNSVVAISIFDNEVMGFMANGYGNIVIGKLKGSEKHVVYNDKDLKAKSNFVCGTSPTSGNIINPVKPGSGAPGTIKCVKLYWEVNNDIYADKGSFFLTTNFVTGLFNQSQVIYFNDNINVILNELKLWDTPSPYGGFSSNDWLNSFGFNLSVFNGDIAHLLSYTNFGGLAWLNGLCNPTWELRQCYSGIDPTYQNFPVFSWNIAVVTHEQGHVMGSPHTHDCAWNNNQTAIDGCGPEAGYESTGDCPDGPIPAMGTIMSYCHLSQNSAVDFSLGFGPQPAELIINNINDAFCLTNCSPCVPIGANDNCFDAQLLKLDSVCNYVSGSICNATADFTSGFNCSLGGENLYSYDVWYKFVATCTDVAIKIKAAGNFDPVLEIYDSPCGLQLNSCTNNTGLGELEKLYLTDLTLGETYYIRIYDYFQNQNSSFNGLPDFDICVMCEKVLPNLTVDLLSSINKVIVTGNNLDITIDVTNNGIIPTNNPTTLTYYISEDSNIEITDYKMEIDYIKKLEVNEHYTVKINADACNFLPENAYGTYHVGFIIDKDNAINEISEADNTWTLLPVEIDCKVSATTSILENKIKLFPNPVSDKLNITGADLENGVVKIVILNAMGQKLKVINERIDDQKLETEFDLNEFNPGIYFLSINIGSKVYTFKVIKI